jgi:hypothetical protein
MNVNDALRFPQPDCCHQIEGTDHIVVAMNHIVATVADLFSQCLDEFEGLTNGDRRTNDPCSQLGHFVVKGSRGRKFAVESPVDRAITIASVTKHPHQPVFYGTSIKGFDYM